MDRRSTRPASSGARDQSAARCRVRDQYTLTVQARDASGNTATSNAVTLTTEASSDVTPPSVPTNVRIIDGFCTEFWVAWTQSTDDTDPWYAIEYEIYVNGVLSPLAVGAGIDRDFVYAADSGVVGGQQRGDGGLLRSVQTAG